MAQLSEAVYDVEFAPPVGRSFHLLAVASKNVTIFALKPLQLVALYSLCRKHTCRILSSKAERLLFLFVAETCVEVDADALPDRIRFSARFHDSFRVADGSATDTSSTEMPTTKFDVKQLASFDAHNGQVTFSFPLYLHLR